MPRRLDVQKFYDRYFAGPKGRRELFDAVAAWRSPERVLYPGSFVHVAASFAFPAITYVDIDRRAERFFAQPADVLALVERHKSYAKTPQISFHASSYEEPLDEAEQSFDMLFSLYAGFISQPCKRYLALGGVLVVNNSHGDAGLASIDPEFELVAAITGKPDRPKVNEASLDRWFEPKRDLVVTEELLRERGRGLAYTKAASAYVFRRVRRQPET